MGQCMLSGQYKGMLLGGAADEMGKEAREGI